MSDKKYIILQQHKFGYNVQDQWTVKFTALNEDKAFEKMVALDTLNDNKDITFHLLNTKYLWQRPNEEPLVLTDEVKQDSESNQEELPF